MNNIFENAYFGKAYKTRDGRKATYHSSGSKVEEEAQEALMSAKGHIDSVTVSHTYSIPYKEEVVNNEK